jgi:hypothetical protein
VNYNLAMDTRNFSIAEVHRDIEISLKNISVAKKYGTTLNMAETTSNKGKNIQFHY